MRGATHRGFESHSLRLLIAVADRYAQLGPRAVLMDPAGVVVLKSSRGRRFWLLFASLFLLATSVYVIAKNTDSWWGWVGVLFFVAFITA